MTSTSRRVPLIIRCPSGILCPCVAGPPDTVTGSGQTFALRQTLLTSHGWAPRGRQGDDPISTRAPEVAANIGIGAMILGLEASFGTWTCSHRTAERPQSVSTIAMAPETAGRRHLQDIHPSHVDACPVLVRAGVEVSGPNQFHFVLVAESVAYTVSTSRNESIARNGRLDCSR
ncbi:hypothetical protein EDB80DRAFT_148453 [Ilyonectria destructans]|nr:hypothetical protein EDB80DRAFT_148453 [Ilyonectria destructans]